MEYITKFTGSFSIDKDLDFKTSELIKQLKYSCDWIYNSETNSIEWNQKKKSLFLQLYPMVRIHN